MLNAAFARRLSARVQSIDKARRALQALSGDILSGSKRAIFAFHRDDLKKGKQELSTARQKLREGWKLVKKEPRIIHEGSWRAAQEEFAEADLFHQYLTKGTIGLVVDVSEDPDVFVGAVSDATGEMVRHAVFLASTGKGERVGKIYDDVSDVVSFLMHMDLTGNLRNKFDQAKQNLRKLEEIRYDLAIRKK